MQICLRLAAARRKLRLNQAEAARKIGIPKSTLSNYELCIVPVKAALALRICRKLILNEEWLATGRFILTEKVGKEHGVGSSPDMHPIYFRQCMDLMGSPEAAKLPLGILFSVAFRECLAPVFRERIRKYFYHIGIPASAWSETDLELGVDITKVLIDRSLMLLTNEALRRKASPNFAGATYLGFLIRMVLFGFKKCVEDKVAITDLGLSAELFTDANLPIIAFRRPDTLHYGPTLASTRTTQLARTEIV